MSGDHQRRPHFELARVYDDGRRQVEAIELRNIGGVIKKGARVAMGRRGFLGLSALGTGALLAACDVAQATTTRPDPARPPTPTATEVPVPTGIAPLGGLLVYSGAGFDYPTSYMLAAGARFLVFARDASSTWLYMRYNHRRTEHDGWVDGLLVTLDPPVPIAALPIANAWDISSTPGPTPTPTPTPRPTPTPTPWPTPTPDTGGGGGGYCTCNEICTCIPVYY